MVVKGIGVVGIKSEEDMFGRVFCDVVVEVVVVELGLFVGVKVGYFVICWYEVVVVGGFIKVAVYGEEEEYLIVFVVFVVVDFGDFLEDVCFFYFLVVLYGEVVVIF